MCFPCCHIIAGKQQVANLWSDSEQYRAARCPIYVGQRSIFISCPTFWSFFFPENKKHCRTDTFLRFITGWWKQTRLPSRPSLLFLVRVMCFCRWTSCRLWWKLLVCRFKWNMTEAKKKTQIKLNGWIQQLRVISDLCPQTQSFVLFTSLKDVKAIKPQKLHINDKNLSFKGSAASECGSMMKRADSDPDWWTR